MNNINDIVRRAVGSPVDMYISTGTNYLRYDYNEPEISDSMMDKLLGRMMTHTQLVILPCKYCGSHNAFSNPTCIKCGAPMGTK